MTTLRDVGDLTTNVVYSPNGRLLVTGAGIDDDSTITVWSATSGAKRLAFDVDHDVTQVGYSPDGLVLATGAGAATSRSGTRPQDGGCAAFRPTTSMSAAWCSPPTAIS